MPELSGNALLGIGAAALALLLFSKPILNAINIEGLKDSLKKLIPGGGSSTTTTENVHSLVAKLLTYFSEKQDEKGMMLAVSVGQHVYQNQVDELTKKLVVQEKELGIQ